MPEVFILARTPSPIHSLLLKISRQSMLLFKVFVLSAVIHTSLEHVSIICVLPHVIGIFMGLVCHMGTKQITDYEVTAY